jgi:UDP-glucose:glycoprotein glucosyltransferase
LTAEAIHQYVLQTVVDNDFLSDPGSLATVKMSLALHVATPKVEAFYEYYADNHGKHAESQDVECDSWVDWYGKTVCDMETLVRLAGIETIDSVNGTAPEP